MEWVILKHSEIGALNHFMNFMCKFETDEILHESLIVFMMIFNNQNISCAQKPVGFANHVMGLITNTQTPMVTLFSCTAFNFLNVLVFQRIHFILLSVTMVTWVIIMLGDTPSHPNS